MIIVVDGLVVLGKGIIVRVFVRYYGLLYLDIGLLYCVVVFSVWWMEFDLVQEVDVVVVCVFDDVVLVDEGLCDDEIGKFVLIVFVYLLVCVVFF